MSILGDRIFAPRKVDRTLRRAIPIAVDRPLRRAMLIDGGFAAKF